MPTPPDLTRRALCAALALLGPVAVAEPARPCVAQFAPAIVALEGVEELLRSDLDRSALSRALSALGEAALPELFRAFSERAPDLTAGDRGALAGALRSHSRERVLALLADQVEASPQRRSSALELLTEWSTPSEVELLFDLAGTAERPDARVLEHFERAVAGLHAERSEAWLALSRATLRAPLLVQDRALRAVRPTRAPHTAKFLDALLNGPDLLAQGALRAIGDLWASDPHLIQDDHLARVAERLERPSVPQCGAALVALGQAQDTTAAARMIELLESDTPSLTRDALWALRASTQMQIDATPALWRHWHKSSLAWWEQRSKTALEDLESGEPARIEPALREIAAQRLQRRELALRVSRVLEQAPVRVAVLCCATLSQLRCSIAIPSLLMSIEDPVSQVRAAACATLQSLTGLDLGPDAPARDWRDALSAADLH